MVFFLVLCMKSAQITQGNYNAVQSYFLYLFEITDKIEDCARAKQIIFVRGKGKRKPDLQRLYDKLVEYVMKMFKYEIHCDLFQGRNRFQATVEMHKKNVWGISRRCMCRCGIWL